MRVAADTRDPDWWRRYFVNKPEIRVDGEAWLHVVEADDVAGYAVVLALRDGQFVVVDNALMTKRVIGKVEIIGERRNG